MQPISNQLKRLIIGMLSIIGLMLIFMFQHIDVAGLLHLADARTTRFLINRTIRFLLNDLLAIGLIYALFYERKYVLFAAGVQVLGMVLVLIPYFVLTRYITHYNGPLLSFLHRLILNPTLLLLLIPAFYYQNRRPD